MPDPLHPATDFCAIDFGTSNSAIALPTPTGVTLVELEPGQRTMPTAVFYGVEGLAPHEEPQRHYGRAAVATYVEGHEGRLMRSMKSILGSTLADQATEVGAGRSVRYLDVVSGYLRHLKSLAETQAGAPLRRAVLGRPVFFVDDEPERDRAAQAALERAAREVGFRDISFQFEPIAAALDYETTIDDEQLVLVADIGGGTSDFSLVRVGPARRQRVDRKDDILGNHGVHIAGTDFDRHIELARILPVCGYRGVGPTGREVPSKVYFDLATWHLINTVYAPARVGELRRMKSFYADLQQHRRLMAVIEARLGHALIGQAESAKIAVAESGAAQIDLALIEAGLSAAIDEPATVAALDADLERIVRAADETLSQAGLANHRVDALYFTGGSTGFRPLAERIAARFPGSRVMRGDRFASVAQGLGVHARRVFA
ncbi:Hsp70 family protein [Aquincola sp. S2]|uniref:Hsp70 family protein n=1 Tax=Pseudaquabacterium terrae TaxID=2732868 RepID=A0ABX2ELX0_9BURK|nr:Hsp70 family protein [Aquabacterium terrae]NRF69565.1 Hsp70 family protein [Aquabacterium terrae]